MKKKRERTEAGSFPGFPLHQALSAKAEKVWQVLAGDYNHWRVGYYSPAESRPDQVSFLEKHSCVELFLLLSGRLTLLVDEGEGERELPLEPMKPVMVAGWHNGYCPDGPHGGVALVVERDQFTTLYRTRP